MRKSLTSGLHCGSSGAFDSDSQQSDLWLLLVISHALLDGYLALLPPYILPVSRPSWQDIPRAPDLTLSS